MSLIYERTAWLPQRTPEGGRVRVTMRLTREVGRRTTVNHLEVGEVVRLSLTGEVVVKYGNPEFDGSIVASGQIVGDVTDSRLRLLWERWHLNDVRSHCSHQNRAVKWDVCPPCPETGYRCGHSWLVETVPPEVVKELAAILGDPDAVVIARDGEVRAVVPPAEVLPTMHHLQGQSLEWATMHEGWTILGQR